MAVAGPTEVLEFYRGLLQNLDRVVDQHVPNRAGSMTESPSRIGISPPSSGRSHPTTPRAAPLVRSSADEVVKAVEPYDADQDQIDRDNIVQQPRHEQNNPRQR